MQKCDLPHSIPPCSKKNDARATVTFSMKTHILELFDKKVAARPDFKTRSDAIEDAMVCWIYRLDDNCEKCPNYDGEEETSEKTDNGKSK